MPTTSGLIVGGPGGHGSTLSLLLRAGLLLLQRFNHGLLVLPLLTTHDTMDWAMGWAGGWSDGWTAAMAQSSGGYGAAAARAEERCGGVSCRVVAAAWPHAARVRCVNGVAAAREDGGRVEERRQRRRTTVRWQCREEQRHGGGVEERQIGKEI
jgi:hypothetical protein